MSVFWGLSRRTKTFRVPFINTPISYRHKNTIVSIPQYILQNRKYLSTLPDNHEVSLSEQDLPFLENVATIRNSDSPTIHPLPIDDPIMRQKAKEKDVISSQEKEMRDSWEGLRLIGRGTSIKRAQQKIADWYYPVTQMLELEKTLINTRVPGEDRSVRYFHRLIVLCVSRHKVHIFLL